MSYLMENLVSPPTSASLSGTAFGFAQWPGKKSPTPISEQIQNNVTEHSQSNVTEHNRINVTERSQINVTEQIRINVTERSRSYINFLIALLFLIKNSTPEYTVIATTQSNNP